MLHDRVEDKGGHGGVYDVVGDAALGEPGLLIITEVDLVPCLVTRYGLE